MENTIINNAEILMQIYYNPANCRTYNIFNYFDIQGIDNYVSNYNTNNKTKHSVDTVIETLKNIKKYYGRLYSREYIRNPYDKEYINDYCNTKLFKDNQTINIKSPNIIRLLSFNVHCFINSCNNFQSSNYNFYKLKEIDDKMNYIINNYPLPDQIKNEYGSYDYDNHKAVIKLIEKCKPDIVALQEYSPVFTDQDSKLNINNFPEILKNNQNINLINYIMSNGHERPQKYYNYIGNLISTKFNLNKQFNNVFYTNNKSNPRVFLGFKTIIETIEVIIFNIHPSAEYEYSKQESINFSQIKTFIKNIIIEYPPNIHNIIICGDYNNHFAYLKNFMRDNLFTSVHDFYDSDRNNYTGYHGTYLDFIYVSINFLYNFNIVDVKILDVNFSDHLPILFDFKKKSNIITRSLERTLIRYKKDFDELLNFGIHPKHRTITINDKIFLNYLKNNLREFLDIENIKKILNCNIITIPKGTFICHGTDKEFFEINDYKCIISDDYNIEEVPKSFTFLHFPFESFMSYYGPNTECSKSRLIIYKLRKDIKVLNLIKDSHHNDEQIYHRLDSYFKLYEYFYSQYTFLPSIPKLDEYDKKYYFLAFKIMRILWVLLNNQLLLNIDFDSGRDNFKYNKNMFYGVLLSDVISNDFGIFKKNYNYYNSTRYGKVELCKGIELQLFIHNIFLDIEGVYYDTKFYNINEWNNTYLTIINKINTNISSYPEINTALNFREQHVSPLIINKIMKRNIVNIYEFFIKLLSSNIFSNSSQLININFLFKQFIENEYLKLDDINLEIPFIVKLILNEFISMIIHSKYFKKLDDDVTVNTPADWDNLLVFRQNNYEEIYKSFIIYIKRSSKPNDNVNVKYFNSHLHIFIQLFHRTRIPEQPLLYLQNFISYNDDNLLNYDNINPTKDTDEYIQRLYN